MNFDKTPKYQMRQKSVYLVLADYPYFERIEVGLCNLNAVCVSAYPLC
jgi:hypothetical protein